MSEEAETNRASGIQVISRAAAILRSVKETETGMSLGQIAERVGLPRSTVQRITSALVDEQFLVTDAQGRGLRLGPALTALAGATQNNIVVQCRLLLTELTGRTGETSDLSVMQGIGMVFLDQVPGFHRLTTVSRVGEVFPLTSTANGKACLSMLDEKKAVKLATNEWDRTGQSHNIDTFVAELREIRSTGLAYDMDEHSSGISAIGFAFRDWSGELHAISVPVPTTRFKDARGKIEQALQETAKSVRSAFA